MHTTMMSANMTAYSTAVGPSSSRRNWTTPRINLEHMRFILSMSGTTARRSPSNQREIVSSYGAQPDLPGEDILDGGSSGEGGCLWRGGMVGGVGVNDHTHPSCYVRSRMGCAQDNVNQPVCISTL